MRSGSGSLRLAEILLRGTGQVMCENHPPAGLWFLEGTAPRIGSMAKDWNAGDPSALLAALFGTTLAPIAGRFGWRRGVLAGFAHSSVAQSVGHLHGGLVLYNDGFAAGLVAAILVPVILSMLPPARDGAAPK